ncbi:MAG: hypothetical protein HZA01_05885 [Nitrospinae bacterium]|nr:hypothetical protein [Nitrospinota bacterium]
MLKKALVIDDVPNSFRPVPLNEDELDSFHVETGEARDSYISFIDEITDKLRTPNIKLLFAGHRGSGKSTELNRLRRMIRGEYFTITFSVRDELDIYNIDYIDLIFTLMEKIFSEGKRAGYIRNQKLIENIHSWLGETTEIKLEETAYGMEIATGVKAGGGLLENIFGLIAEVKNHFKMSGKTQTEMRRKIEPGISALKNYCNLLINEMELSLKKENKSLLIIIEDADKLECGKARDIFYEHSGILSEVNTRMIFSIHIFFLNSPFYKNLESKYEKVTFPMIKINNRDGSPSKEGRDILEAIVGKRMDLSLMDGDARKLALEKSGGNIRDLFKIIENASMAGKSKKESTIKRDKIEYGIDKVKADYNRTIVDVNESGFEVTASALYERLVKIHRDNNKILEMDNPILVLLNTQAVLEYNGRQWFDIHPIVVDLLRDMKKI